MSLDPGSADVQLLVTLLCGAAILIGVLGSAVQVLPGPTLIAGSVLVWALVQQSTIGWVAFGLCVLLLVVGQVLEYLLAGRRLGKANIPRRSIVVAVLAGIVGFFVVPVLGLFLFFVGGLYLAEYARLRDAKAALPSTRTALGAVGIIVLVELSTSMLAAGVWLAAALGPSIVSQLTG